MSVYSVSNNHSTVMSEEQSPPSPEGVVKRDGHEAELRGEEEEDDDDDDSDDDEEDGDLALDNSE